MLHTRVQTPLTTAVIEWVSYTSESKWPQYILLVSERHRPPFSFTCRGRARPHLAVHSVHAIMMFMTFFVRVVGHRWQVFFFI